MYQLVFICIFTALVLAELVLASLVDRFPKVEDLERDEVSFVCPDIIITGFPHLLESSGKLLWSRKVLEKYP